MKDPVEQVLHTYSVPRPCGGLNIPIAIQSVYLRDYAYRTGLVFCLPKVEWCIPGVYSELFSMLCRDDITNLAVCSLHMFPPPATMRACESEFSQKIVVHFILENLRIPISRVASHQAHIAEYRCLSRADD
jgi:sporadic carbohydrate cluster protein (TIGR04323 family)